jgi:hypothetical protein
MSNFHGTTCRIEISRTPLASGNAFDGFGHGQTKGLKLLPRRY